MQETVDARYRNEIKYVCSERQIALIEERIRAICQKDVHAGEAELYTVRSVYLDDFDNTCFYENEDGTDPREKYRIRIYNADTGYILLESKQKKKGRTHKDSCRLTLGQCQAILDGSLDWTLAGEGNLGPDQRKLMNRFFLQYSTRPLRAKVIVEYERVPYVYQTGNVRITFDRNISGSRQVQDFLKPRLALRPVMPKGEHILEVKYDELMPDYLYNVMQLGELRQTAYSKYYTCRRFCG